MKILWLDSSVPVDYRLYADDEVTEIDINTLPLKEQVSLVRENGHLMRLIQKQTYQLQSVTLRNSGAFGHYIRNPTKSIRKRILKQTQGWGLASINNRTKEDEIAALIINPHTIELIENPDKDHLKIVRTNQSLFFKKYQ
jgi:hypothetical protein